MNDNQKSSRKDEAVQAIRTKAEENRRAAEIKQNELSEALANFLVKFSDENSKRTVTEADIMQFQTKLAEAAPYVNDNKGLKYIVKELQTVLESPQAPFLRQQLRENNENTNKVQSLLAKSETNSAAKEDLVDRNARYQQTIRSAIKGTKTLSESSLNSLDRYIARKEIQKLEKMLDKVEKMMEFQAPKSENHNPQNPKNRPSFKAILEQKQQAKAAEVEKDTEKQEQLQSLGRASRGG